MYLSPSEAERHCRVSKSLAIWDLVNVSLQHSGVLELGRSTFAIDFQRCCELGREKQHSLCRHGSGALRIDFQKCMTKLSCMTIEELTNSDADQRSPHR